jgi:hypothetical protein
MKTNIFEAAARYAANLARLSREPKKIKISRSVGGNQAQECARRRRFYERHGCMPGGGPRWEDDPRNPRRGYKVGTVIIAPGPGPQDG